MSYQIVVSGTNGRRIVSETTFQTENLARSQQDSYVKLLVRCGYFSESQVETVKIEVVNDRR